MIKANSSYYDILTNLIIFSVHPRLLPQHSLFFESISKGLSSPQLQELIGKRQCFFNNFTTAADKLRWVMNDLRGPILTQIVVRLKYKFYT